MLKLRRTFKFARKRKSSLPNRVVISPVNTDEMRELDFMDHVLTGLRNGSITSVTSENKESGDGNPVGELEGRCPYLF